MNIEFAFRTYNTFGLNATQSLASKWISERIAPSYGGGVRAIWFVGCCRNVSPPKRTLEREHERFEKSFASLPAFSRLPEDGEIEVAYDAIRFTHDEVVRDNRVLSVWTFRHVLGKASDLIPRLGQWPNCPKRLDHEALARDLAWAADDAPRSLEELVELFQEQRHGDD